MSSKPPCFGCNDRAQGCHAKCQKYAEWKAVHEQERKEEQSERRKYGQYLGYLRDTSSRLRKGKREHE